MTWISWKLRLVLALSGTPDKAHAKAVYRRGEAQEGQDAASIRAVEVMDELFGIVAQSRDGNMDRARRHALRQEKALFLPDQIRSHILAMSKMVLPKCAAGLRAE